MTGVRGSFNYRRYRRYFGTGAFGGKYVTSITVVGVKVEVRTAACARPRRWITKGEERSFVRCAVSGVRLIDVARIRKTELANDVCVKFVRGLRENSHLDREADNRKAEAKLALVEISRNWSTTT